MFNGKIHYKGSFSIAMLNYQRVNIHQPAIYPSTIRGPRFWPIAIYEPKLHMPFFNYHKIGATVSSHAQKDTSVAVLRTEVMKEVGDKVIETTVKWVSNNGRSSVGYNHTIKNWGSKPMKYHEIMKFTRLPWDRFEDLDTSVATKRHDTCS